MNNLPKNFEREESAYNSHYDPYAYTCPNCGEEISEESEKCKYCGANLVDVCDGAVGEGSLW